MIRPVASLGICFSCVSVASAEELLQAISWKTLRDEGNLRLGEVIATDGGVAGVLSLENTARGPISWQVFTIDKPGITSSRYAITGQVRYQDVEGSGYLEMWSCFAGDQRCFSRTLETSGPMQALKGSSGWRRFVVPFYNKEGTPPPEKLILTVVLPGRGKVWLSPLDLVQFEPGEDPLAVKGQWWKDRTGGLIGGVAGSIIGCMGGLIGWLTSRGRARGSVTAMLRAMQIVGVLSLIGGAAALLLAQPYAVYYPLLLMGLICALLGTGLVRTVRKRYDELELRKMRAMDAV
jgi:hypothetical protein